MHLINIFLCDLHLARRIHIQMIDKLLKNFDRRIEPDTLYMVKAFQLSIFGNHGDTVIHGIDSASDVHLFAFQLDVSLSSFCKAEDTLHRLRTACTDESGKAQDLALTEFEADVFYAGMKLLTVTDMLTPQHDFI